MGSHKVILYLISFLVIVNGLRVLFNLTIHLNHRHYSCCKCHPSDAVSHTKGVNKGAFDDDRTLTRIGSMLDFNYSSCPKNSVMLNSARLNAKPLHDNCPRVFIIGARKGGTTSLYQYLSRHPDFQGVQLDKGPSAGETFYFSSRYGKLPWEDYISQFPLDKISGDSSVGNLVNCMVPERLYRSCGRAVKIIILLRDPLQRYESNFRMRVRLSTKQMNSNSKISMFLKAEIHRLYEMFVQRNINMNDLTANINDLLCLYGPAKNCIYEGMYYAHLHTWLCNFPAENILILNTEEFHNNTKRIFSQVLDFVGLESLDDRILDTITKVKYNYGGKVEDEADFRLLNSSDRKKLQTIYKPFNEKLLDLLKWQNVNWNN